MNKFFTFSFPFFLILIFFANVNGQKHPLVVSNINNGIDAVDTPTKILNGELHRCGIEAVLERIYNDPDLLKEYEDNKKPLPETRFQFNRINCNAANTVNIPLAFHFDNSFSCANSACMLSEIQDAISTLNVDFGNNTGSPNAANCPTAYPDISTGSCINFYLAVPPACSNLDPACDGAITIGQFQGGYNTPGGSGAGNCWDDYLNVFVQSPQSGNLGVSDQIPGYLNAAGPGEGVSLGAPYFGGSGGPCSPFDTDNTYNAGGTLAHEIGHFLGLPHIWGDVNGGGCGGDDGFADTPNQSAQYFGCPNNCVASGCGGSQQTANFMNYTDDACMDLFSEDQAATMNFYANQFFAGLNIPAANPTELFTECTGNTCSVTCPASASSTYSDTDAVCASAGTYTLPTSYPGLTLDDPSGATYTFSTGAYLPSGTAITGTSYSLTNPAGCNPSTETLYLNVSCTTDNTVNINGGTLVLTTYPDPSQFSITDLVNVTGENNCNEPTVTPLCSEVTVSADAANPAFPVTAGQSGTANYTATYTPPAGAPNCCTGGGGTGSELITNGDFEAGSTGWTETEEVPSGTPNPSPFGIIGVSNSNLNGTTDAWFGGWGGTSTLTISQNINIPATCAEANLTFDFLMSCAGDVGITLDVVVNGVVLGTLACNDTANGTIAPFDLIAAGAATGNVTISFVGTEDGTGTGEPDIFVDNISLVTANCAAPAVCDFPVTANYNCAGCNDCNDTTCTTTQTCNDNDPCTSNDEETILSSSGSICVPCAGTAIVSCSGSTSVVSCNDFDACTTNDVQTIDDCDNSICVPCAGTLDTSSCNAACTTTQACNDGNACTTNDIVVLAANGLVCTPCAGILNTASCNAACTTTQACNDGNDCTVNDMQTLAANGSVCVPCAGTVSNSACCAEVDLTIFFDGFPSQTSWNITDTNGSIVASSGNYSSQPSNSTMMLNGVTCLQDGCYDLNFNDSLNNGMCPFQSSAVGVSTFITPGTLITPGSIVGTLSLVASPGLCGNYTLFDANGGVLVSGGGAFGASQTNNFCLVNGALPRLGNSNDLTKEKVNSNFNINASLNDINILPNPVNDVMTVNFYGFETGEIMLIDMLGKVLQQQNIKASAPGLAKFDVSDFDAGIYFVLLQSNETILTKKFIKK